jgi:hypothetical protein
LENTLENTLGKIIPSSEKPGTSGEGSAKESPKEKASDKEQEEEKSEGGFLSRLLDPLLP